MKPESFTTPKLLALLFLHNPRCLTLVEFDILVNIGRQRTCTGVGSTSWQGLRAQHSPNRRLRETLLTKAKAYEHPFGWARLRRSLLSFVNKFLFVNALCARRPSSMWHCFPLFLFHSLWTSCSLWNHSSLDWCLRLRTFFPSKIPIHSVYNICGYYLWAL